MNTVAHVRPFEPDDAAAVDALLRAGFAETVDAFPGAPGALALGSARLAQTGNRLLVAECGTALCGVVRWWDEDGFAWCDLLVSERPGAGRKLLRAVEREAQDSGLRLLRARIPDRWGLPGYFARLGYLPVAREGDGLVVEKRLPLLTVREQRRGDAAVIARLTGEDAWPFEQGARPGWFVLADGERVGGAIAVRDGRDGTARVTHLALAEGYRGRSLEAWMLDRAALYAETSGCHSITAAATDALRRLERRLEESRWHREGDAFMRQLG